MGRKPSKSSGKAKQSNVPVEKDDGSRWRVIDGDGQPVYISNGGIMKGQAERLAYGLVQPAYIEQVK